MDSKPALVFGSSDSEYLSVCPRQRMGAGKSDFYDDNWVRSVVDVQIGGFRGHVEGNLRAEEFVAFREGLHQLHDCLKGEAVFETMESWLKIRIDGDGRGHIKARCEVRDDPDGNRLSFVLNFDQTHLPILIQALDDVIVAFPVVGRR